LVSGSIHAEACRPAAPRPDARKKLGGEVEVDETFIGGKARNMHAAKRKRLGISQSRSMIGKVVSTTAR